MIMDSNVKKSFKEIEGLETETRWDDFFIKIETIANDTSCIDQYRIKRRLGREVIEFLKPLFRRLVYATTYFFILLFLTSEGKFKSEVSLFITPLSNFHESQIFHEVIVKELTIISEFFSNGDIESCQLV